MERTRHFSTRCGQQNISNTRQVVYTPVLTDTARLGIFRYFPFFAPMGYNVNPTIPNQQLPVTASTASWVAVDVNGNPVAPPGIRMARPTPRKLTCFSVFGNMRLDANGNMVPFTAADCPGGTAVFPQSSPAANGMWDSYRPTADTDRLHQKAPEPDAARQLLRRPGRSESGAIRVSAARGGSQGGNVQQITDPNANSKQINIKIDHNFSSNHKAAFNYTYQRDDSDANISSWPDGPAGAMFRRPHVFTANVTSTLSSSIVNEARFGMNRNYNSTIPAYLNPDGGLGTAGEQYLLPGGQSTLNPNYNYLVTVGSSTGRVGSGTGPLNVGLDSWTKSILYSFADTLSWSQRQTCLQVRRRAAVTAECRKRRGEPVSGRHAGQQWQRNSDRWPIRHRRKFPGIDRACSSQLTRQRRQSANGRKQPAVFPERIRQPGEPVLLHQEFHQH